MIYGEKSLLMWDNLSNRGHLIGYQGIIILLIYIDTLITINTDWKAQQRKSKNEWVLVDSVKMRSTLT